MRYFLFLLLVSCSLITKNQETYPGKWWTAVPDGELHSWEIDPSSVEPPRVVLSKRNELGWLSNFAATPFRFKGKSFASMEGLWQSMKYPENNRDPRHKLANWPHTREEVEQMSAFEAKRAGDFGSRVMKKNNIDWVSFESKRMEYREPGRGEFYNLIRNAMEEKVKQNPNVRDVLVSTGDLELLPDHNQGNHPPEAWQYPKIYMEIRRTLKKSDE